MEACVRGFSFIPENKIQVQEAMDLQYIEGGELERTWKTTRRERMKQREKKIWEKFVQEQDIASSVCNDDPYQFLENLPEPVLIEIMESELQKMRQEVQEDPKSPIELINADFPPEDKQHVCTVTFADDGEKNDGDVFQIFDDENAIEKDDELSGPEEEDLQNDSPCTVREGCVSGAQSPEVCLETKSSKSSENVSNVIESSIYCAKLKDLRLKINDEILAMISTLEGIDMTSAELEDITRMCKRSVEFCTRFNRIHVYQLQRQMHDVKRNNSVSLPFAKHTQFQAQMVRLVALHQSLLQACQVCHKSLEQTACLRGGGAALRALAGTVRAAGALGADVPAPRDFAAAADLYHDELLATCDKLEEAVDGHSRKYRDILAETTNTPTSMKTVRPRRKKIPVLLSKSGSKTEAEARLSMYSLDTRIHSKSSSSKGNQSGGTSKIRLPLSSVGSKAGPTDKSEQPPKTQRKTPRCRRPLMRDPHAGRPRAARPARDSDVRTMVEAVEVCASSHISREPSLSAFRSKDTTPRSLRTNRHSPRKSLQNTPRSNLLHDLKTRVRDSPRDKNTLEPIGNFKNCSPNMLSNFQAKITSVSKILNSSSKRSDIKSLSKKDLSLKINNDVSQKTHVKDTNKKDSEGSQGNDGDYKNVHTQETKSESRTPRNKYVFTKEREYHYRNKIIEEYDSKTDAGKSESSRVDAAPSSSRNPYSPKQEDERETNTEKARAKMSSSSPARCEVTRLIKQLCSGDGAGTRTERVVGVKNAQLVCVSGGSPRQPSTPQLLRILEETIQKKIPKPLFQQLDSSPRDLEKYRLAFNISDSTADNLFQYRTKFVQHMLNSPMYANSAVGKPWEMVGSVSDQIIDEVLLSCAKEMELQHVLQEMFACETH